MKYSGFLAIESKACEGVTFTIKKMTVARRTRLEELQAPIQSKIRPLREELAPLSKEYGEAVEAAQNLVQPQRGKLIAAGRSKEDADLIVPLGPLGMPDEKIRQALELSRAIAKIDRGELTPAAVRFALVRIEGLEIDGVPGDLDLLLENGPDELYEEIAAAVAKELGLLPEERENLSSPSTSAAAVDGATGIGSAEAAGKPDTITIAGALSSTAPVSVDASSTSTV